MLAKTYMRACEDVQYRRGDRESEYQFGMAVGGGTRGQFALVCRPAEKRSRLSLVIFLAELPACT